MAQNNNEWQVVTRKRKSRKPLDKPQPKFDASEHTTFKEFFLELVQLFDRTQRARPELRVSSASFHIELANQLVKFNLRRLTIAAQRLRVNLGLNRFWTMVRKLEAEVFGYATVYHLVYALHCSLQRRKIVPIAQVITSFGIPDEWTIEELLEPGDENYKALLHQYFTAFDQVQGRDIEKKRLRQELTSWVPRYLNEADRLYDWQYASMSAFMAYDSDFDEERFEDDMENMEDDILMGFEDYSF